MATSSVQPLQTISDTQLAANRSQALSLVWGGFMLAILGMWLGTQHDDLPVALRLLIWIMAAISFGCGIWEFLSLGRAAATVQKHTELHKQRKILGMVMLAGGLLLVGAALFVALTFGLAAFGESVGMILLGLGALAGGFHVIKEKPAGAEVHSFFDLLRRHNGQFGLVLLVLGALLVLTAFVLVLIIKLEQAWYPEMAAVLLLGLLGISGGIWLLNSQTQDLTTAKMRVFVLVVGGVCGLILALAALVRAFIWRDDVFGGMRAWQGERSWHLWLCAYVELIGLALMFVSLLLARADIRSSVVLRRALFGYNAVLTGLLLLATLVVLNIVVYAIFPNSYLWSKSRGTYTLSVSTKNFLNNLRVPTTFYVLLPRDRLTSELNNFIENCQSQTNKLTVKFLSPVKDFEEYENLVKRFPDSLGGRRGPDGPIDRGILVVYGEIPPDPATKVPHAFIAVDRFEEFLPTQSREEGGKGTLLFKGESEIMKELSFLAQDRKKRTVYFLQGNGELDINQTDRKTRNNLKDDLAPLGCGQLVEALKKEQFEIQGLSFAKQLPQDKTTNLVYAKEVGPDKRKDVPEDADAVVIAGPGVPLDFTILNALERYMDKGGKLLVFLDIVLDAQGTRMVSTGLEGFLRKYGVLAGDDFALRVVGEGDDPRFVIATTPRESTNDLANAFAREPFPMRTTRIVRPDPEAKKYKAEVVLNLDRRDPRLRFNYLSENNVRALNNPVTFLEDLEKQGALDGRIIPEPLPVALAVSEKLLDPGSGKETLKPRLLVFGDAECLDNYDIIRNKLGYPWVAGALEWMSEKQGLIGPQPLESSTYSLNPFRVNIDRIKMLPLWLMMLTVLGLGAGIWVFRRR